MVRNGLTRKNVSDREGLDVDEFAVYVPSLCKTRQPFRMSCPFSVERRSIRERSSELVRDEIYDESGKGFVTQMRVTKHRIRLLATAVVDRLRGQRLLDISGSKDRLVETLDRAITHELSLEDRLHEEIRRLLQQYDAEFQSGRADYDRMFTMVKNRLVNERELIL